jgi:hypothetical protein
MDTWKEHANIARSVKSYKNFKMKRVFKELKVLLQALHHDRLIKSNIKSTLNVMFNKDI